LYGIEENREKLLETVASSPESACSKNVDNRWTILEILEHLWLMEKSFGSLLKTLINQKEGQPAPKKKPVHLTVDRSTKVEAPTEFVPSGLFTSKNEALKALEKSRNELLGVLSNVDETLLSSRCAKHPSFGRMNLDQWVEFIGLHEERHRLQIEELISEVAKQES
jgi:hypothetical protein